MRCEALCEAITCRAALQQLAATRCTGQQVDANFCSTGCAVAQSNSVILHCAEACCLTENLPQDAYLTLAACTWCSAVSFMWHVVAVLWHLKPSSFASAAFLPVQIQPLTWTFVWHVCQPCLPGRRFEILQVVCHRAQSGVCDASWCMFRRFLMFNKWNFLEIGRSTFLWVSQKLETSEADMTDQSLDSFRRPVSGCLNWFLRPKVRKVLNGIFSHMLTGCIQEQGCEKDCKKSENFAFPSSISLIYIHDSTNYAAIAMCKGRPSRSDRTPTRSLLLDHPRLAW